MSVRRVGIGIGRAEVGYLYDDPAVGFQEAMHLFQNFQDIVHMLECVIQKYEIKHTRFKRPGCVVAVVHHIHSRESQNIHPDGPRQLTVPAPDIKCPHTLQYIFSDESVFGINLWGPTLVVHIFILREAGYKAIYSFCPGLPTMSLDERVGSLYFLGVALKRFCYCPRKALTIVRLCEEHFTL